MEICEFVGPVDCAGNAIMAGVDEVLPISVGPNMPAVAGVLVVEPGAGTIGSVTCEGSVPNTIRQLNKRQRVIKPVARGLNIRGVKESVYYPR